MQYHKKIHRSIWEYGNHTNISSACAKTLQCLVERSLNFTQHHQQLCSSLTLLCTHCSESVRKCVVSSTAAPHTQAGRFALLLLSIPTGLSCPEVRTKTCWGKPEVRPQQSSNPNLARLLRPPG